MSVKVLSLLVGLFALCGSAVRADIHPSVMPVVSIESTTTQQADSGDSSWSDGAPAFDEVGFGAACGSSGLGVLSEEPLRWNPDDVRELPAAPGSASLFLSAVLSVGAWNLVRSAKHIHFNIPEWYHTGAPDRIGSTVAFDLVCNEMLPCVFVDAVADQPSLRPPRRAHQWRLKPQICVVDADPRGPPLGV